MNRRRLRWPTAIAVLALIAGCDDKSTGPDGETSSVVIRAYVDVDGSGTYNAGDTPIAGQPVSLESTEDSRTLQATTSATGEATFEDVRAGSYSAVLAGTAPAGAVLATASRPVVVAPFDGGTVEGEFRFVFNPGSIAGRVFRDNNGNGTFDAGTDLAAPGIPVALFRGTDVTGDAFATTTTAADGSFEFMTLRPGTYTYVISPLPTMTITGGSEVTVEVAAQQATPAAALFTGNLISSVADVRTQPEGTTVALEGVVTAGVGIFSSSTTGNQFNVQDASGAGILVLQVPVASGIALGDSVRVIGTTDISSGEYLITGNPSVTVLATGRTVPAPRVVTAEQVAASTAADPLQGSLVQVGNVRVTAVSGNATAPSYNVSVTDDAGNAFTIRVGSANVGVPQTYWEIGRYYDIVGLLAAFNTPQIKIRSAADVSLRSNATPIGTLRMMAYADSAGVDGDTVTVEGVVHTAQGTFRTDNAFIQDATGGILLFNVPASAELAVGDSIRVTAVVDWFNGELELVRFPSTAPPVIEKLGTAATPQPRTISGAQFNSRAFEGELVRIGNAVVDSLQPGTGASYTAYLSTVDGSDVQVRIENAGIGLPRTAWTVGSSYNIVGALTHRLGVVQLKPRSAADVTPGTTGVITIAAAEDRPAGDTVTVEGVVLVEVGPFGSSNTYIDDGTDGIQLFGVPATDTLRIGDVIRVRGVTGAFRGETQISRFPSGGPLLDITKVASAPEPVPFLISGAQAASREFEGRLVTVEGVTVVTGSTSTGGYNIVVRAADGTEFEIRNDRASVGVPSSFFVVGEKYDVTGVMAYFDGTRQIKFRSPDDVVRR